MKYIGNFKELIDERTVNHIMNNPGEKRPKQNPETHQTEIYQKLFNAGYTLDRMSWEFYHTEDFNWDIIVPFKGNVRWWFSKLNPGDLFPLHIDTYPEDKPVKRYWMAYTDYTPGHVFTYGNNLLSNYVAGDVYEFDDTKIYHGACNLSFTPKISLQLVVSEM
jgi:hypothetical protein